jgi:EAL domain-containing protein (putative c-di-GMP-specific phosphodiesterase class I)
MYQPIVNTVDGRITGFEALLRWDHPMRGPVPPTTFIRLAEQSNLINQIGQWVLGQACADRSLWQQLCPWQDIGIAVNVSAQQLMVESFPETVAYALGTNNTAPHLLTLEITESVFVRDSKRALNVLGQLKELGVTIALDDFGTGYSSLSYLNHFPVDIVKIDRTFVANVGHDPVSEIIVNSVVQLAHALNMKVVAEGIETEEQRSSVTALGCDSSQGYYFARPMPAAAVTALLRQSPRGSQPTLPRTARTSATRSR